MSATEWALHVALLVAGYLAGRLRPVRALVDWNWDRTIRSPDANGADLVLWVVLNPIKAARTLRRRDEVEQVNDPQVGERWRTPRD
ncbi:hypothetical protein [Cellulosimicrobium sp. Marseille-Q4280]|uniref:hypothetical protein n=1 Tax=Cellulosimicrobium sp. Marseille-Q4280 TaxID=2937992 RepID=UPI00203B0C0A|nr:hypothetical protein [Cellulosimicrobium sp. Marseille-Q4280]